MIKYLINSGSARPRHHHEFDSGSHRRRFRQFPGLGLGPCARARRRQRFVRTLPARLPFSFITYTGPNNSRRAASLKASTTAFR